MSAYFLDSSALVKRYRTEAGSVRIKMLVETVAEHTITICEITSSATLRRRNKTRLPYCVSPNPLTSIWRSAIIVLS